MFRRYVQFCLVGSTGTALDMGLIYLLASPSQLGWNLSLSKVVAAEVALVNNFVWNDLWTFRHCADTGWRPRLGRLLKFNLICGVGIGWSVGLLNLQVYGFHWNVYLSNFIAIVFVSFWNYWLNARFGWNVTRVSGAQGQEVSTAG